MDSALPLAQVLAAISHATFRAASFSGDYSYPSCHHSPSPVTEDRRDLDPSSELSTVFDRHLRVAWVDNNATRRWPLKGKHFCTGAFRLGREEPHDDKCLSPEASAGPIAALDQSTFGKTNDFATSH